MQICVDAGGGRSQKREISAEYVRFSNRAIVSIRQPGSYARVRIAVQVFRQFAQKVQAGFLRASKRF